MRASVKGAERRMAKGTSGMGLRTVGAVLIPLSVLLAGIGMFLALFALVNHVKLYITVGVPLTFVGFLLLPMVGVIVWFRPEGGNPPRLRRLSLAVLFLDLIAIAYWIAVLIGGLMSPISWDFMPEGLALTILAYSALSVIALLRVITHPRNTREGALS